MQTTEVAAVLEAAPTDHARRCALTKSAIDTQRWPAAACNLRASASLAQEWADRARALANWCDAQAECGRIHSTVPADSGTAGLFSPFDLAGQATLEAVEAGLMALAHGLSREHAVRVRRAMSGVLQAKIHGAHGVSA